VISRDRDFAMCIAHEEAGQGPSLERLILDRSFKEAAALLEPGMSIPVAVLPNDAALWLAGWLDKRGLQLDRDGDDWFVTKRGERGADLAARLGVAVHVLLPPLLITIFALLMSACDAAPEPADVVTESAGFDREAPLPSIYLPQHPDFEQAWTMVNGPGHAPSVIIVEDKDIAPECGDRYLHPVLGCVGGDYDPGTNTVHVLRRALWWRLGHEFNHASKFLRTGRGDSAHGGYVGWDVATKWDRDVIEPVEKFLAERGW
jgi:hypothetical protein